MTNQIENIKNAIEPLRQEIINHKVYSAIKNIEDLQLFMQYHVYAVWDFMSLLKTLQNNLTCTAVPWFPEGSADTRHLINEIVVGEESDIDLAGVRKSHFEMYLDAMNQSGTDTSSIKDFLSILKKTADFNLAFSVADTPNEARDFVNFTFDVIRCNKAHLQAAIFTFGREDLIPDMFFSIVNEIHSNFPQQISIFKYYVERHIEVDGDQHSHLAIQMTENLCASNHQYWKEAEEIVVRALQQRIELWNGVYRHLTERATSNKNLGCLENA